MVCVCDMCVRRELVVESADTVGKAIAGELLTHIQNVINYAVSQVETLKGSVDISIKANKEFTLQATSDLKSMKCSFEAHVKCRNCVHRSKALLKNKKMSQTCRPS